MKVLKKLASTEFWGFDWPKDLKLVALVVLLPFAAYFLRQVFWLYDTRVSLMERQARQMAGLWAVDCGYVKYQGQDGPQTIAHGRQVDACMVEAFQSGRAFVGHKYHESGVGSWEEFIAGTRDGRVYSISSVYNPALSESVSESVYRYKRPRVEQEPWPQLRD